MGTLEKEQGVSALELTAGWSGQAGRQPRLGSERRGVSISAGGPWKGNLGRGHDCSKGPASSGSGARPQSTSLGRELREQTRPRTGLGVKPGPRLASETEVGAPDSRFPRRPRDGTKGGTTPLRSRTAFRSTDPAGSHLAATASSHERVVRRPGLVVN